MKAQNDSFFLMTVVRADEESAELFWVFCVEKSMT